MINAEIQVGSRKIGLNHPPFIIAEMSGNHNQSLDRALAIVDAAAESGAHALKIQTYTADSMTIDIAEREFLISDKKSLWSGESLYNLYKKAATPYEWHEAIFNRCAEKGMIGFSTPFDLEAVDFLEKFKMPLYKVASFENTDLPLIRKIASTGKPMIVSTGMASIAEIDETVRAAQVAGNNDLILLKCTSSYPASPINTNLKTISHMRDLFKVQTGLSDHTMGVGASVASIAFGATVIEKHFTLSRAEGGVDSAFSLEPHEFKSLVIESERAWQALGEITYGPSVEDKKSLQYRRSLYIVKDLKKGDRITPDNIRAIRPGLGLPPKYLERVLNKMVNRDVARGTAMSWDLI
ncbi:MAG: pseudaminic acid synthase [Proteobacteria bacterium]|nr:MAG: pseudaminic acid synthase [Pseudomonadota bacterium]